MELLGSQRIKLSTKESSKWLVRKRAFWKGEKLETLRSQQRSTDLEVKTGKSRQLREEVRLWLCKSSLGFLKRDSNGHCLMRHFKQRISDFTVRTSARCPGFGGQAMRIKEERETN